MLRLLRHINPLVLLLAASLQLIFVHSVIAQTDTTFWFVAPEVAVGHSDRPVGFRVTSQGQAATVNISMPTNPGFTPVTLNVSANGTNTITFTGDNNLDIIENRPHNSILSKGFLITATTPITAYYEVISAGNNPDIFALKGRNALGTEFFVPSQQEMPNVHGHERIDIVATENNTQITVTPTANLEGTGMAPVTITLNRGETYSFRAESQAANVSLRGTRITANKKIAVTISDDSVRGGNIYGGGCFDLLGDQLIPVNIIGQEYIAIRGFLDQVASQIREKVYILAVHDSTTIYINGVLQTVLNRGQTFQDTFVSDQIYVQATKNVYFMHISGFGCETGMAILPPIACTGSSQVGFTRTTSEFFGLYVFTENGNQSSFSLNGNTNRLVASDFDTVPGTNSAWVYARKEFTTGQVAVNSGQLLINTAGKFHMGVINGGASTGCRYGFFSDFARYLVETSTNSSASSPICEGDTLRVWADSIVGATQYTWTTPRGIQLGRELVIPVSALSDTGWYKAWTIVDGCRSENDSVLVVLKPKPANPNINNTGPYCVGDTIRFTADLVAGATYQWSGPNGFNSNLRQPTIPNSSLSDTGIYQLQLTLNGCSGEVYTTRVIVHPIPARPNASAVDSALCPGDTLRLLTDSLPGATYIWSGPSGFSSNFRNPIINGIGASQTGAYLLQISVNGCISPADTVQVYLLPGPLAVAVLSGSLSSCDGDTTRLRIAPAFGNSYQWFRNGIAIRPGSANDTLLIVTSSGRYQVEATSIFGCTDTAASVQVTVRPPLNTTISPSFSPPIVCLGDTVRLRANHQAGYTYRWLRNGVVIAGATDSVLRVSSAGTYQIEITDSNNCRATGTGGIVVQTVNPPIAALQPTGNFSFCAEDSVRLRAPFDTLASYQWLRNNQPIAGATDSTFTTDSVGSYRIIMRYISGCFDTSSATTLSLFPSPTATLNLLGDSVRCTEDSARLAGPSTGGLSYQWFRNNVLLPNIDSVLTTRLSGSYRLVVTSTQGCRDSSRIQQVQFRSPSAPTRLVPAQINICNHDSTTLRISRNGNGSLQWFLNGAALVGATDSFLTVRLTGEYVARITDTLGCVAFGDTIRVANFPTTAAVLLQPNPNETCQGGSINLQAGPAGMSYAWLRNDTLLVGQNNSSLTVNQSGQYRVIVTNVNGCRDTSVARRITIHPLPTVSIFSTRTTFCPSDTIILRANRDTSLIYQWLRNGIAILGAQSDSLVASLPGQYVVIITDTNNCTAASNSITLNQFPAANVTLSINGPINFCLGDSTNLQVPTIAGSRYQWLRNNAVLANDTFPTLGVRQSGAYRVIVTTSNGCLDTSLSQSINVNSLPSAVLAPLANDSLCVGDSLTLQALNTVGLTLQWLRNGVLVPGQSSANFTVNQAGNYQLIVTNASGCRDSSDTVSIRIRPQPLATLLLSGPTQFCEGDTVVLRGPISNQLSYQWFRNGLLMPQNSDSLSVTTSGTYVLKVTDLQGCTDTSASVNVLVDTLPLATIQPSGILGFCTGINQTLSAPVQAGVSYQWLLNGAPIPGATASTFSTTTPGFYRVIVTQAATACSDTSLATELQLFPQPTVSISNIDSTIRCTGESVRFTSTSTGTNLNFQWLRNGLLLAGSIGSSLNVIQSGTYQLVVTNQQGCADTSNSITVNILTTPSAVAIRPGPFDLCEGDPLVLEVPLQAFVQYQWFRNSISVPGATSHQLNVTESGIYNCAVSHQNGCGQLSQDINVNFDPRPETPVLSSNGPVCHGETVTLFASSVVGVSYDWRGPLNYRSGARNPVIPNANRNNSGWYYCTTIQNGCRSLPDSIFVRIESPIPPFTIRGKTRLCTGNTLKLEVDSIAGGNYIWSRSNGQQFSGSRLVIENVWLTDSGTYSIDLNVNGCSVPPKEIRVTVNDHTFYFPTAFTPNGDGLNEVFKPATFYEGPYDIRIYDRWGQLVFQSNDPKEAWDGSVFGGPGDAGAYNYIVSYEGCVRDKEFLNGVVYLIK